jgi:uncharacterized membrane protein
MDEIREVGYEHGTTLFAGLRKYRASQGRDSPIFLQFFYLFSIFFPNRFYIASKLLLTPPGHHLA